MQVPAPIEYARATSIEDAVGLLERLGEEARVIAGGHSLLPMMKLRLATPEYLVDINDLHGSLSYIETDGNVVRIGAMTRHRELLEDAARHLVVVPGSARGPPTGRPAGPPGTPATPRPPACRPGRTPRR